MIYFTEDPEAENPHYRLMPEEEYVSRYGVQPTKEGKWVCDNPYSQDVKDTVTALHANSPEELAYSHEQAREDI